MPATDPFETHPDRYDAWFDDHPAAYESELNAVRECWPEVHPSLEVGIGTGRFGGPLGVDVGVDPSPEMRRRAEARGLDVRDGTAENLPFDDDQFAAVLNVTTICFVDRVDEALSETRRVLRSGGVFVVGMLDRDSPLGHEIEERGNVGPFYRESTLHGASEVATAMRTAGFVRIDRRQTLFSNPDALQAPDPVRPGSGDGGFVVLRGEVQ